jgi:hypothetical protein
MKIQAGVIVASPALVRMWLKHVSTSNLGEPEAGADYFLFRSGAKLVYHGKNRWSVKAYAFGRRDIDKVDHRAAMAELRAALYLHQAESQLIKLEQESGTTPRFMPTYCGMEGSYPDGRHISSRR